VRLTLCSLTVRSNAAMMASAGAVHPRVSHGRASEGLEASPRRQDSTLYIGSIAGTYVLVMKPKSRLRDLLNMVEVSVRGTQSCKVQ
jgi:hypothetical protein